MLLHLIILQLRISDIRGLEEIWFFGDRFVSKTCFSYLINSDATSQHFKNKIPFVMENFEVKYFSNYNNRDNNPSYLARMQSLLIKALRDRKFLPRAVVVVIEDDLVFDAGIDDAGAGNLYQESITWLAERYASIIHQYSNQLPTKSRRKESTEFLWIASPHHESFMNNGLRKKFNSAMYNSIAKLDGMNTIKLKGNWDTANFCLVNKGILTGEGLFRYWEAVNLGCKFWLEVMLVTPKFPRQHSSFQDTKAFNHNSKFGYQKGKAWQRLPLVEASGEERRQLPQPKPKVTSVY